MRWQLLAADQPRLPGGAVVQRVLQAEADAAGCCSGSSRSCSSGGGVGHVLILNLLVSISILSRHIGHVRIHVCILIVYGAAAPV